ncbi:MAG: hypothetical protein LBI33_11220 [Propionibacteriaceae bacterium]|jgi:hypothetical protein|nr:hypothetical protein [Propionibacteriaceae bacterium]
MPEQLIIGFNPMAAANRVAYTGSVVRGRVMWLVVAALMCTAIWVWQRTSMSASTTALMYGVGLGLSVVWLVVALINWARAKSALAAISPGIAAAVDRQGMWLKGTGMAWPEIARVAIMPSRFGGSPYLVVERVDGHLASISLADLDVIPGTIDAAVRSFSGGTQAIDTSKLGN